MAGLLGNLPSMATRGARLGLGLGLGLGLVYHTEHGHQGREAALRHAEAEEDGACAQQHLGGCRVRVRVRVGVRESWLGFTRRQAEAAPGWVCLRERSCAGKAGVVRGRLEG